MWDIKKEEGKKEKGDSIFHLNHVGYKAGREIFYIQG